MMAHEGSRGKQRTSAMVASSLTRDQTLCLFTAHPDTWEARRGPSLVGLGMRQPRASGADKRAGRLEEDGAGERAVAKRLG